MTFSGGSDPASTLRAIQSSTLNRLFGDRYGLSIFLFILIFLFTIWRTHFFITDNYTIANTLVSASDGHLWVDPIVYGPQSGDQPGMHIVNGRLYGRNYGLVFLSLPWLWILELLAFIIDPRVVIAAAWSLCIVLFSRQFGRFIDREGALTVVGCSVALLAMASNIVFATELSRDRFPIMALQLTTMVSVGFVGVLGYRVTKWFYSKRTAIVIGLSLVFGTPLPFWGVVPKRHAITAAIILLIIYAFVNSRKGNLRSIRRYRALSYIAIGGLAWIHAAEALALLIVLTPIDYLTAPSNRPRDILFISLMFGISLTPFFLTNILISGNPIQPPRLLPSYFGGNLSTAGSVSNNPVQSNGDGGLGLLMTISNSIYFAINQLFGFLFEGFTVLIRHPDRLVRTFLRSGWLESAKQHYEPAINLTVLESAPILGVIAALPMALKRFVRGAVSSQFQIRDWTIPRQTDLLIVSIIGVFIMVYLPRLPLYAQVTVRYLVPIIPLLVIAGSRIRFVFETIDDNFHLVAWSYSIATLVGGQLLAVIVLSLDPTLGEAVQFHGLLGIGLATILAIWALSRDLIQEYHEFAGAMLLGTGGALSTVFVIMASWVYFDYGQLALGIFRVISEALIATF